MDDESDKLIEEYQVTGVGRDQNEAVREREGVDSSICNEDYKE